MPGTTVPLGFPYPVAGDPLAGPANIQALAEAVDVSVTATQGLADTASSPPAIKLIGGPQAILNNTLTDLRFDSVVYDNTGTVDLVGNPTTVTPPLVGQYVIVATVVFAANVTASRLLQILQGGTVISFALLPASPTATFPTSISVQTLRGFPFPIATIKLQVRQNSGVTLNVTSCSLGLWRVGP